MVSHDAPQQQQPATQRSNSPKQTLVIVLAVALLAAIGAVAYFATASVSADSATVVAAQSFDSAPAEAAGEASSTPQFLPTDRGAEIDTPHTEKVVAGARPAATDSKLDASPADEDVAAERSSPDAETDVPATGEDLAAEPAVAESSVAESSSPDAAVDSPAANAQDTTDDTTEETTAEDTDPDTSVTNPSPDAADPHVGDDGGPGHDPNPPATCVIPTRSGGCVAECVDGGINALGECVPYCGAEAHNSVHDCVPRETAATCPEGFQQTADGQNCFQAAEVTCTDGQEVFQGVCVDAEPAAATCPAGNTVDEDGNCRRVIPQPACADGQEVVDSVCVDVVTAVECPAGSTPTNDGDCKQQGCDPGQDLVNGACVASCSGLEVRNAAGACESGNIATLDGNDALMPVRPIDENDSSTTIRPIDDDALATLRPIDGN